MQEIKLTVSGNDAPIPLGVENARIIHDGGLPAGGTTGQVLTKVSDDDGDADWQTPSDGAVQSVNGQTGTVVLGAVDVGAGTYSKPAGGIPASDLAAGVIPEVPVQDVQVNGVSVLQDGVANVPKATNVTPGVACFEINDSSNSYGLGFYSGNNNLVVISGAALSHTKNGTNGFKPIVPSHQHESTFYGLAKAAGSDEKNSTLPVGQYTESAKSAISQMLNGAVSVSGTTPVINALPGVRYVCGEVATLEIILPESGIVDVTFESGSTPTVLTVTPPTGVTLKWANGFDPDNLDADTAYEINIMNGLGVAASWT